MLEAIKMLLRSRKFLLSLVAVIQTVVFHFFPDIPDSLWIAIDGILAWLIANIALEDAAAKRAGGL